MDPTLAEIFANATIYQLSALAGLAMFFVLMGIQEIRDHSSQGYLYVTIALFLAIGHGVLLENAITCDPLLPQLNNLDFWRWLVLLVAPALIVLFLARAIVSFVRYDAREGLIKTFFGLTLMCYLYMVGSHWPVDIRGIVTILWVALLFKTEMAVTN
ncbi:MAG: hypothetical protein AB1772_03535 [Candidatus Zixiibacteriota bacterium]